MIDWSKELEAIFNDPLLADVTAPKRRTTSSDRLIAGFQEISGFVEENGRPPEESTETRLFHRLKGILSDPSKIERCRPFDTQGILAEDKVEEPAESYITPELTTEEKLEKVFRDPLFDDITEGDNLFDVPDYMKKRLEARKNAEYVGSRRPCDDFDKYSDGFKEIHQGLKSGKYKLMKFEEPHVGAGRYFIEQGTLLYVAGVEEITKNRFGRKDGRIHCIYENGSESDILKLTLCKSIYTNGGYSIINTEGVSNEEFERHFTINDNDIHSGTIYVLRSKSNRRDISSIKNLYKIGFTATSVESRIANARNEPTYLCADVEIVATWKVYNVKSSTFEALIHKLFDCVKLQITVDGYRPKEWFIVPLPIIEKAVNAIITGKSIIYDAGLQQLIYLNTD